MAPAVLRVLVTGGGATSEPATLSPLDLALLRGEAVFETLRIYAGRPFALDAHLERLARSAAAVDVNLPDGLEALALDAAAATTEDGSLRLICTRGVEPRPGKPGEERTGTAVAICSDLPDGLEEERRRGMRLCTLTLAVDPLVRAASPWLLAGAKSTSYAVNMAAQRTARARGADDAIMTGLGGELLEATTATLWWRAGDTLLTPALDLGILAGVTRAVLMELAPRTGLRVVQGVFTFEDLIGAEEAFLSSSVREVMPVVGVDGTKIGDGRPGPAARRLQAALRRRAGATG